MLDVQQINRIVQDAAASTFKSGSFSRALVEPTADSQGDDAWNVTIVLNSDFAALADHEALDAMVKIDRHLRESGEDRLAIVNFATEDELASHGAFEL